MPFSANIPCRLQGVKMSERALKDLEKGKDNSIKSYITKPVLNANKYANKKEKAPSACQDFGHVWLEAWGTCLVKSDGWKLPEKLIVFT